MASAERPSARTDPLAARTDATPRPADGHAPRPADGPAPRPADGPTPRPTDGPVARSLDPDAPWAGAADGVVALDQLFDGEGLFQLRSAVAAHGADLGLTEPRLADLVLLAHELASNAVRHGGASPAAPGRLRLWRSDGALHCEVTDHGPGLPDPAAGHAPAAPGAAGGRGLWIVRQVARDLDIRTGPHGTTVTATLPL